MTVLTASLPVTHSSLGLEIHQRVTELYALLTGRNSPKTRRNPQFPHSGKGEAGGKKTGERASVAKQSTTTTTVQGNPLEGTLSLEYSNLVHIVMGDRRGSAVDPRNSQKNNHRLRLGVSSGTSSAGRGFWALFAPSSSP